MAIIPKPPGTIDPPNNPSAEAAGTVAAPNDPTAKAAGSVAIPNNPSAEAVAAIPRTLTPLVNIDFAAGCFSQRCDPISFADLFTYSRSSSATFINRRLDDCGNAEFFLDTDFVGNVTNLALFSEQFDNAAWVKANTIVLANNDNNVDGFKTADRLHPATTGTLRGISQAITATTAEHNVSFRVKAAGFQWVKVFDAANTNGAWFNVSVGVVGTITGNCEPSIEPLGNGWFRCSIGDAGAVAGFANIILADADNSTTATLNGTDGVLLDAAQLTLGVKALPYVKTLASTVLQAFAETLRIEYDPVTSENLGALIEGSSTNLLSKSDEFDDVSWIKTNSTITVNNIKSPDNTISSDKIEAGSTASILPSLSKSVTVVISNTHTNSYYVKKGEVDFIQISYNTGQVANNPRANYDIVQGVLGTVDADIIADIENIGNGYFRISATVVTATTALNCITNLIKSATDTRNQSNSWIAGEGIFIWGAQLEQQSFATSYIRTELSTVSRVADDLSIPQAGNEVPTGSDVTYFTDIDFPSLPSGGTSNTRHVFRSNGISSTFSILSVKSTGELEVFHGSAAPDIAADGFFPNSFKCAFTFTKSTNNIQGFIDGLAASGGDAGSQWELNSSGIMQIGASGSGGSGNIFGHIKSLQIYNTALTAQEVALL